MYKMKIVSNLLIHRIFNGKIYALEIKSQKDLGKGVWVCLLTKFCLILILIPPVPPLQQYRTIAHTPTRVFQTPSYNLLEYLSLYSLEEYVKLLIPGKKALLRWNGGSEFKSS